MALPSPCKVPHGPAIPGELHFTLLPLCPCPVSEHPGASHRTPLVPPASLAGEHPLWRVTLGPSRPCPLGPAWRWLSARVRRGKTSNWVLERLNDAVSS